MQLTKTELDAGATSAPSFLGFARR